MPFDDFPFHLPPFDPNQRRPDYGRTGTATVHYSYKEIDKYVMLNEVTYDQIEIEESFIGPASRFMQEGLQGISIYWLAGFIIGVKLPKTVDLEVVEISDLAIDTTSGGATAQATLSTGAVITVPVQIKVGDMLRVDPYSGTYLAQVER